MKKAVSIFVLFFCFASPASAQTKTKNELLLNSAGNQVTLGAPVAVTNNTILFPGTLGLQGALFYIGSVAGSVGTTTWLNPGTNGFMLSLSGGLPAWMDPALILGASYWSLSGNATATAYNGAAGSYLGTTSLFPLVLATTNATAQPIEFFNGGLERARIASTGQLLINTTIPQATVTVNGETYSNTFLAQVNTSKPAWQEGRFFYDTAEKTMAYYNDHNGVTLNVGQEDWIRVYNATGVSIANGSAVYVNGVNAATGLPTVALAKADQSLTADAIGITTETIPTGSLGYVTAFGVIHNLNTTAYTAGQPVYVSATTAGAVTSTRPNQPNFTNPIGYIAATDAVLGKILVMAGKSRQGAMTTGAVAFGGTDGFLKENPTGFFFDSTNVRLGIGTNTPGQKLEVKNGNILLSNNTATAGQLQFQGTSTGITTFQAGAQAATNINYILPTTLTVTPTPGIGILQYTGTGTLAWLDPTTIVPASSWLISGNATASAFNGAAGNFLGTTSLFPLVLATTNVTAQPIEFFNGGLERMRVASTGQLLIGTTTPLAILTVNGETYSNTFLTQVNAAKPAWQEGRFFYDIAEKTMAYYNDHNGVTLNVGQEEWVRAFNATGASIINGSAVYINGVDVGTGLPTVALAKADLITTADAIGITTETIPTGSFGYVTAFGVIHNLNTTAYTAGQPIYVSATTAGAVTSTRPNQPSFTNPIGYIAATDAVLGKILVMAGKSRQGAMTTGAVAFGGTDGFIKENPTNLFWDNTNLRFGIGTNAPVSPLSVTEPITASGGSGIGTLLNQTVTAAANNNVLYGINITPTFTNGAFTGLTNYSLHSVYAGTLANSAAIRGEATGNGGASTEVIGVWGIATNATQGLSTNAGVGVRAEGNNTTTLDANSNTALQVVNGGIVVGRQASSAANDNTLNILVAGEDDNNGLTDQGPSGIVDVTDGGLPPTRATTTGFLTVFNRYAKAHSIILVTPMDGGTGVLDAANGEVMTFRVSTRANSSFRIEVNRNETANVGSAGTAGKFRFGFLIINPGRE